MSNIDWPDDQVLMLEGLWAAGHSTAEIGRRMGLTKNAVVGKSHRLGLPARPSPIIGGNSPYHVQRREAPAQRAAQRELAKPPKPVVVEIAVVAVQTPRPVRTGPGSECQWPTTVNGKHRMLCDAPCIRGRPYCSQHLHEGTSGRPQLGERTQIKLAAAHAG